ncbi:MAG: HAD family hydrolase [Mariprofundus sp.]|nr:HAD family hydrolase [Mariprofundus sp.]
MIDGVLLDMDGTLVDAFPPIIRALNQTFSEYGLAQMSAHDIKRHTGRGDCSMTALFGAQKAEATRRFLEIHDEDYLQRITPLEGAEALLLWLKNMHIPCAIVTSKSQERAEAQLNILGWSHLLQAVVGKTAERVGKPDPAPLLLACDMLSIKPAETIFMLGDGVADMKGAKRAGCSALGLCDAFSAEELTQVGADHCFNSLTEVNIWLKKIH